MSLAADDGFRKGFTNPGTRTTLGAGYRAVAHRALLQKHPPEAVNFHESGELFLSWVAGLLSVWGTPMPLVRSGDTKCPSGIAFRLDERPCLRGLEFKLTQ